MTKLISFTVFLIGLMGILVNSKVITTSKPFSSDKTLLNYFSSLPSQDQTDELVKNGVEWNENSIIDDKGRIRVDESKFQNKKKSSLNASGKDEIRLSRNMETSSLSSSSTSSSLKSSNTPSRTSKNYKPKGMKKNTKKIQETSNESSNDVNEALDLLDLTKSSLAPEIVSFRSDVIEDKTITSEVESNKVESDQVESDQVESDQVELGQVETTSNESETSDNNSVSDVESVPSTIPSKKSPARRAVNYPIPDSGKVINQTKQIKKVTGTLNGRYKVHQEL